MSIYVPTHEAVVNGNGADLCPASFGLLDDAGMREFIWNAASRYAINELIKLTALNTVTTAAALPMYILNAAAKLDDPW
jgi:hypothetical protein